MVCTSCLSLVEAEWFRAPRTAASDANTGVELLYHSRAIIILMEGKRNREIMRCELQE